MKEFLFPIGDYLKGRPIYPVIRRILNVLFSVSIASFLFEKFYFKYNWLDISDYKGILSFFIKGYFVVPFSIFIIVHYIIDLFASFFFTWSTLKASTKLTKAAAQFELKREDATNLLNRINNNGVIEMPEELSEPILLKYYQYIKKEVSAEQWNQLELDAAKQKNNVEKNFNLMVKAILVISIYFASIPYFGWKLYTVVIFVLIVLLIGFWIAYLLLDVLPPAFRRFRYEADMYLTEKDNRGI